VLDKAKSVEDTRFAMHEARKTVTLLFADVVGSTGLGERLDPETLRQVMSRYFAEMAEVVEQHGGTVEKFIGDEVMAVFGVPSIREDDALRAVRAAAAMRSRLHELNVELEQRWGARLEIRVGINTGQVVAGDPSGGHGFVTGDAVNLAKRIEQAASPGEILLGRETARIVGHAVTTTTAGPFTAKGKSDEIMAERLDEVDLTSEALPRHLDSPMVDRANELTALLDAYTKAVETRRPQLVTVFGLPGIGKSRLARELLAGVAREAHVLVGRCIPYGEGITFWPVREINPDETFEGTREEIFWRTRKHLEAFARERPLAVCFEDVHWAEPTFLDLVQYLAGWIHDAPILILCLARADLLDRRPDWPRDGEDASTLALGPLSEDESSQLLELLDAPEAARARIVLAAEGNPLFVEQMTAMTADEGAEVVVPPSIQAVLAARLDGLSPDELMVLECAAVIGRDFSLQAAHDLIPEHLRPQLSSLLLGLMRKELVRPHSIRDEDGFRFRHALIRDAAYDRMPKGLRAELHERHADSLGSVLPEDILAGYHLEQAVHLRASLGLADAYTDELALRAGTLLGAAGQRAYGRGDMPAARTLLERSVALLGRVGEGSLALQRLLANAMWQLGRVDEADALLRTVREDAERAGEQGIEWYARLDQAERRSMVRREGAADLHATATSAIPVFEELGDETGLARARRALGVVAIRAGRYADAQRHVDRALAHARAARSADEQARAADVLCTALLFGPAEASFAADRCRELLDGARGNLVLQANVASSLAGIVAMLGAWDEARSLYARARGIFEELGLRMPLAGLTQITGPIELLAGDAEAAARELKTGFEILSAAGARGPLAPQAALLARALIAQGRDDEAAPLLELAEEVMSEDLPSQVVVSAVRSQAATRSGQLDAAREAALAAIEAADRTDALNLAAEAHAALAAALAASGSAEESRAALERALELYERKGNISAAEQLRMSQALFVPADT
jgi:class 3 adenylate cyclase/tetratricopeptide (TPR) repeat protein